MYVSPMENLRNKHECARAHTHTHVNIYIYIYVYIYIYIYIRHVFIRAYIYIYMRECMYTCQVHTQNRRMPVLPESARGGTAGVRRGS